jgi:hypothetical protein
MASDVEIVNAALTLLGESRIISLNDNQKPARDAKAIFATSRDALLAAYNWSFAKTRVQLTASAITPLFGFDRAFPLPVDCLRVLTVGDYYVGADLSDYRGANPEVFTIEGRQILTNLGAPLNVQYVKRVEDASQFHPCFVKAFGCQLAFDLAESITQSNTKRQSMDRERNHQISLAVRANAIELPPQKLADDEWLLSRR